MAMSVRKDVLPFTTGINTPQLFPASQLLTEIIGVEPQPNKAIVGKNAFAHEAGIHQDGFLKERTTYEIMDPRSVGVPESRLVLGKHSGRHALVDRCKDLGFTLTAGAGRELLPAVHRHVRPQEVGQRRGDRRPRPPGPPGHRRRLAGQPYVTPRCRRACCRDAGRDPAPRPACAGGSCPGAAPAAGIRRRRPARRRSRGRPPAGSITSCRICSRSFSDSTGNSTSTRRSRLRGIQSADDRKNASLALGAEHEHPLVLEEAPHDRDAPGCCPTRPGRPGAGSRCRGCTGRSSRPPATPGTAPGSPGSRPASSSWRRCAPACPRGPRWSAARSCASTASARPVGATASLR